MTHPRTALARRVLERAIDAGDALVAAACRRVIRADRLGWRKHGDPDLLHILRAFDD